MKDFIKWLGVNEKVAKVVVWLFIIMIMLIVTNTMLESIGVPYYAITYDNLKKINSNEVYDFLIASIISLLNFYSIVLLVFKIKESKKIFKYSLLYLFLNSIFIGTISEKLVSVFIVLYVIWFCYIFSNKKLKYALYGLIACIINIIVQAIWFMSKVRFINFTMLNDATKSVLSIDYFIIMSIIIIVKEIYLKKRGEKKCLENQDAYFGSANSKTKANSQRKSQKK